MAVEIIAKARNAKLTEARSRQEIAFAANLQIEKMAGLLKEHYMKTAGDDWPLYHGMLGRIQQLSECVYYAAELGGPREETGGPSMEDLQRFLDGELSLIMGDGVQRG